MNGFNKLLKEYILAGYDPKNITINSMGGIAANNSVDFIYKGSLDGRNNKMSVSDKESNNWRWMLDTSTNLKVSMLDQLLVDTAFLLYVKNHHLCNYKSLYLYFTDYVANLEEVKINLSSE